MLRLILRSALMVFLLCAGAFGLAVAAGQAPPDPLIEQVLHEGCKGIDRPCWFGIVPGVTSFQDAIDRLYEHPWIGSVDVSELPSPYVSWLWASDAPAAIRGEGASAGGYLWVSYPDYHLVEGIHVWTALSQGEYWLSLGQPERAGQALGAIGYSSAAPAGKGQDRVIASTFANGAVILHSGFRCPATIRGFFSAAAAISFYDRPPRAVGDLVAGGLRDWLFRAPCPG